MRKTHGAKVLTSPRPAGQNPKSLSGEELSSEFWVDAGSEALSPQCAACFVGFEGVEGGVANDGEVEGRIVFAGSAAIFVEGYVHRPMEVVFDAPMGAHGLEDGLGVGFERGDVEPCLEAFGAGLLVNAPGGDRGERTQALPVGVALGEPARIGGAA